MKQNTKLIFLGILSSTLLLGCAASKINFSLNPNETNVIKFADEVRLAYDRSNAAQTPNVQSLLNAALGKDKAETKRTTFVEELKNRRQIDVAWEPAVPLFQKNDAIQMSAGVLNAQFRRICSNNSGKYEEGWCLKPSTGVPLFWAKATNFTWYSGDRAYPIEHHSIHMVVFVPLNKETDSSWIKLANSRGVRTTSQINSESKFLLSSKARGATVCRRGVSDDVYPGNGYVQRGYLEDANNGKVKVRVIKSVQQRDGVIDQGRNMDSHGTRVEKEIVVWSTPNEWSVCE